MNKLIFIILFCALFSISFAQEKHEVNKGDTLWDLADKYYNDSSTWPTIWKHNTFINNPDLIYPAETLVIPGYTKGGDRLSEYNSDVFKLGSGASNMASIDSNNTNSMADTSDYTVEKKPAIKAIKTASGLEIIPYSFNFNGTFAYETLVKKTPNMKVVATKEGKSFVSTGDVLRINAGADNNLKPGDGIIIFSLDKKLSEGYVLEIDGYGIVQKVDTDNSLVMLKRSYDSISKGHFAAKFEGFNKANPKGFMNINSDSTGKIIYLHDDMVLGGQGNNCIIDIGLNDGVKQGDILYITRLIKDDKFERNVKLAEIQVIYVNDFSATALIIQSDSEVKINDTAILKKVAVY